MNNCTVSGTFKEFSWLLTDFNFFFKWLSYIFLLARNWSQFSVLFILPYLKNLGKTQKTIKTQAVKKNKLDSKTFKNWNRKLLDDLLPQQTFVCFINVFNHLKQGALSHSGFKDAEKNWNRKLLMTHSQRQWLQSYPNLLHK